MRLSDSKYPQVSKTLLSILAVLDNAVVWTIATRHPTSKSSSPFNSPLVTVPNAPTTIGIIVTFKLSFLLLIIIKSGLLAEIGGSVCLSNYCNYYYLHWTFSHQRQLMVFHKSLSDNKSPQVSRTLYSILAVVVWMACTHPPNSKSSSSFINPLVTVPKAPIIIGIIITFMFHSFFNSLGRSRYLSLFSHSFSFILWSAGTAKSTILQVLVSVDYYKVSGSGRD